MPRSSCDQLEKCDVQGGQFREGDSSALVKGVNEISRETILEKGPTRCHIANRRSKTRKIICSEYC